MDDLVGRFGGHRVLVVGDAIVDEYLSGECARLSPEAPVPVLTVRGVRQVLGGSANTAANVTSLGGRATLLAAVGRDAAGEDLIRLAREGGIAFDPIHDDRPTLRKTRVVGQHQQLVRLDYEESGPVGDAARSAVLRAFEREVTRCDIVVVSDYAKGLLTADGCRDIIRLSHRAGREVIIDPRPQHRDFYTGCDYLTPNWKESLALVDRPDVQPTSEGIRLTGEALARTFGANILLTLGAEGMAFFSRDGHEGFSVPTVARDVFDVSGAGDTMVAAFALARVAGADHRTAVALANRAAGVVIGKFGTATVSAAELMSGDDSADRIVARSDLASLCATLRAKGKRIVTLNGAFDVLHAGHVYFLREARKQGDVVIVGLNSDASVRGYKGAGRPVFPQAQRAEMLLSLRDVDFVHIFDEPTPIAFLEQVQPAVHVNGAEYGENCVEAATVSRLGGRLHLVQRLEGLSTTNVVRALGA